MAHFLFRDQIEFEKRDRSLSLNLNDPEGVEDLIARTSAHLTKKSSKSKIEISRIPSPKPMPDTKRNIDQILTNMREIEKKREIEQVNEQKEKILSEMDKTKDEIMRSAKSDKRALFFNTKAISELLEGEDEGPGLALIDYENSEVVKGLQNDVEKSQIELIQSCDKFSQDFTKKVVDSKEKIEKYLVESFKEIASVKMPNVFLRSIKNFLIDISPKTKRALKLFEKYPKKRQNTVKPKFTEENLETISVIIKKLVNESFFISIEIINQLINDMKVFMGDVHRHNQDISDIVVMMKDQSEKLNEEMSNTFDILKSKKEILDTLYEEMKMKKIQHSIMEDQFKRRKNHLENQRREFIKELSKIKGMFEEDVVTWEKKTDVKVPSYLRLENLEIKEIEKNMSTEEKLQRKLEFVEKKIDNELARITTDIAEKIEDKNSTLEKKISKLMRLQGELVRVKSKK